MAKKFSQLVQEMSPDAQVNITARARKVREEYVQQKNLREIRKALALTQVELAERLTIQQAAVSKIESQTDMYVSTLRKVIEALGGRLHIRASFADTTEFEIDQFSQHPPHVLTGTDV